MEQPKMNYAVAYQRFRARANEMIVQLQKEYPLPSYMMEGIFSSLLADIRSAALAESVIEEENLQKENQKYYEEQLKNSNDELLKLKAEKQNNAESS